MKKEIIEFFDKETKEELLQAVRDIAETARRLNSEAMKKNVVAKPLPGTEYLHDLLIDEKVIDTRLYLLLRRIAEDPTIEYTIEI